jgi:hypothetical protein
LNVFKIDEPLALARTLTEGLADRVIETMRKGDLRTTAALYNDLIFLQAAVEQLQPKEKP